MQFIWVHRIEGMYDKIHKIIKSHYPIWKEEILFSWQWWLSLVLAVLPWVIWCFYRKKDSTHRLLYSGFFVIIISSWFDFIGVQLGLWVYKYSLLPTSPAYIPWDLCIIPVSVMFLLQFKPKWNPLIKAFAFGGIAAFIGEPIFIFLGLYTAKNWSHVYSLFIYAGIFGIAHYLSRRKSFNELSE